MKSFTNHISRKSSRFGDLFIINMIGIPLHHVTEWNCSTPSQFVKWQSGKWRSGNYCENTCLDVRCCLLSLTYSGMHRLLVMLTVYVVNYEGVIALGLKRVKITVPSSSHMVSIMLMECQLWRTDSRSLSVIGLGLKLVKTTVHSSSHMVSIM